MKLVRLQPTRAEKAGTSPLLPAPYDGGPVTFAIDFYNSRSAPVRAGFKLSPLTQTFSAELAPKTFTTSVVVDTNGAGDAFFAGFLAASLTGEGLDGCLAAGARQAVVALSSEHLHPAVAAGGVTSALQ